MGMWGTIGQMALQIAPYAAAPFTGGASLAFAPYTAAIGTGLQVAANAKANNRGEKYAGQMDLEQQMLQRDHLYQQQQIDREKDNRAGTSDAFKKLLATGRVMNPGPKTQLSKYSIKPRQASPEELQGAQALQAEVLSRLQRGNPVSAPVRRDSNVDPKLLDASGLENFLGIAGAGLGAYGRMSQPQYPYQTPPYNPRGGQPHGPL